MQRLTPGRQPAGIVPNVGAFFRLQLLYRPPFQIGALHDPYLGLQIVIEKLKNSFAGGLFEIERSLHGYIDFHRSVRLINRSLWKRNQEPAQAAQESDEEKSTLAPPKDLPVFQKLVSFRRFRLHLDGFGILGLGERSSMAVRENDLAAGIVRIVLRVIHD